MKFKVFCTIFISFILVMATSSLGGLVGEKLKEAASLSILEETLGEDAKGKTQKELIDLAMSGDNTESGESAEKLLAANKRVSQEFKWYFIANLVFQLIVFVGIAMAATHITVKQIKTGKQIKTVKQIKPSCER